MRRVALFCAAFAAVGCVSAQAAFVTGVTATTDMGTYPGYSLTHLVDGAGLSAPISASSLHDTNYLNMWMSNSGTAGTITFNLGGVEELSQMLIWNYNGGFALNRGVQTYSLSYSTDNLSYTPLLASTSLPQGTGSALAAQSVSMPVTAQYVKLTIEESWGAPYAGLSEVQFVTIPEPAAVILLLVACCGLMVRKTEKGRTRAH